MGDYMKEVLEKDEKRCSKCKSIKKLTEFSTRGKLTSRASRCRVCTAEDNRDAYKSKQPETIKSAHLYVILNSATRAIHATTNQAN